MTLRHFKIFVAVCDRLNMTAAAKSLFMSQSAVSQAIAELEKYYGVRLFERLTKKLYLTSAGENLLGYARHMVRMNEEIENSMKTLAGSGSVRVGASVTVGASVLPHLILRYRQANPAVEVEVFEDNTARIEKRILRDTTDIGLVEGETASQDLITLPFLTDELVLVCGREHRFAALRSVAPDELEREPFIIREEGSGTRKTFEDGMKAKGLSFHAGWVCNNADTIKAAVAEGLGVTVISRRAVESEVNRGLLCIREIEGIRFFRQFRMIVHKNKYLTAAMRRFMDLCLNQDGLRESPDEAGVKKRPVQNTGRTKD
ncbi:HTH-type transcriptional activator CmpR [Caprobacter fermentans]|uniref:HTH-type transcriptional activator CmpR n=1 Tax=Caproicibacter fermentans TaxID=2576756 RepID=A0A6N8HV60_9FIRM|nr:LysR family transcriptional regulator [Caproicibacter fermentans]MVB09592.1 HTH-type transcriptional activator CmpR [Caproicibacter fermentans]OCN01829.1 transcriptional regulator [Clostridium sp. W14A]